MGLNFDSILIVTYGRSGSTLLQGILNSVDGVLIRGENFNFIEGLYESYRRLVDSKEKYAPREEIPQEPWYGASLVDFDLFFDHCRKLVKDVLLEQCDDYAGVRCYGFKEIRYLRVKDLEGYLDFLMKIFPNPAFVINTRELDEVVKSGWWVNHDPNVVKSEILNFEKRILQYSEKIKNIFYNITYSDVVNKKEKLQGLFDFIGAEYVEAEIDKVLSLPHSYTLNTSS